MSGSTAQTPLTWEEFSARTDLRGGDFELHSDNEIGRGPISRIEFPNGRVRVWTTWWAKQDPQTKEWFNSENYRPMVSLSRSKTWSRFFTQQSDDHEVVVFIPGYTDCRLIFHPKGTNKLPRSRVKTRPTT